MAINKVLATFVTLLIIYAAGGAVHIFIPLYTRMSLDRTQTPSDVASTILLDHVPLDVSFGTGVLILLSSLVATPAIFSSKPRFRHFLTLHAYLVILSGLLTLAVGLRIWFSTLRTKSNLQPIFETQSTYLQSMLQYKFKCCGYDQPTLFVKDTTCTSTAVAARLGGCITPFTSYANKFLDIVFTAFFGIVAVESFLLISVFCLMKHRGEQQRYRLIDRKSRYGSSI